MDRRNRLRQEFCPFCEKDTIPELIKETPAWECRGEFIKVNNEYFRCPKCGEEWWVEGQGLNDPFEQLYTEYEKRTGINPRYRKE
jgi:YgiT-type zinc finger domain-containing protein